MTSPGEAGVGITWSCVEIGCADEVAVAAAEEKSPAGVHAAKPNSPRKRAFDIVLMEIIGTASILNTLRSPLSFLLKGYFLGISHINTPATINSPSTSPQKPGATCVIHSVEFLLKKCDDFIKAWTSIAVSTSETKPSERCQSTTLGKF
jgi:hypothetical protein